MRRNAGWRDGEANDLRGAMLRANLRLRDVLFEQSCMNQGPGGISDPRPERAGKLSDLVRAWVGPQVRKKPRGTSRESIRLWGIRDQLDGCS